MRRSHNLGRRWPLHKSFLALLFVLAVLLPAHAKMRIHRNVSFDQFPEELKRHAAEHPLREGFLDVTCPPYSATGDGTTDDTESIRRAIRDAFENNLVVYFPPGTYLVSGRLDCIQSVAHLRGLSGQNFGQRKFGHKLRGATRGPRPVIRLKDHSRIEGGALIVFEYRNKQGRSSPASHYIAEFRGIDIDMGRNPDVSALSMSGAQNCVIEDVQIRGEFYAGIRNVPGSGGSVTNVRITGGRIGVLATEYRPCPLLTGIVLENQREAGIKVTNARGPVTVVGFHIRSPVPPPQGYSAIVSEPPWRGDGGKPGGDQGRANLNLIDGSIELAGPGAAVRHADRGVYMENVFVKAQWCVLNTDRHGEAATVSGDAHRWKRIERFIYASPTEGEVVAIDGERKTARGQGYLEARIVKGRPPGDLVARHAWNASFPSWDEGTVLDIARDFGATPDDDSDDDGPAIQRAIDTAVDPASPHHGKTVFIPRGHFHLKSPVVVKPGLRLIGAANNISVLHAHESWQPDGPGAIVDSVRKAGTESAGVILADFAILGQAGDEARGAGAHENLSLLRIRTPRTLIRNIQVLRIEDFGPRKRRFKEPAIVFEDGAGGRVYNLCHDISLPSLPESVLDESRYHHLLLRRVRGPLRFYALSIEHLRRGGSQVWIDRSADVTIYAFKYEKNNQLLRIDDSRRITIFGGTGNYALTERDERAIVACRDCSDLLFVNLTRRDDWRGRRARSPGPEPEGRFWIIDESRSFRLSDDYAILFYQETRPLQGAGRR